MTTSTEIAPAGITATELAALLNQHPPTPEQTAVIEADLAPMLVVAGAGSGKTETMAARVVYLVANKLVEPGQVLGLTFTRKAAAELTRRIRTRLASLAAAGVGNDPDGGLGTGTGTEAGRRGEHDVSDAEPTISTYHAFAGQLITEFGPLAGIEPPRTILTPTASWQLARSVVGRWDGDLDTDLAPERVTQDVLAISAAMADHLTDSDELATELERLLRTFEAAPRGSRQQKPVHSGLENRLTQLRDRQSIVPLVHAYDTAKRALYAVDFADQLRLTARIVRASPRVGEALRERHGVVLLDEYQDTGHSQRIILRTLFGYPDPDSAASLPTWCGHPVVAVGDPVQSIYGWRGASASNLPRFTTDFPTKNGEPAPHCSLLTSFRNCPEVLELANKISEPLRQEPVPVDTLNARAGAPAGTVRAGLLTTIDDENAWLAAAMRDACDAATAPTPGDTAPTEPAPAEIAATSAEPPSAAVLLRRRADMAAVATALRAQGLSVEIVGVGGLIDEPEVADVLATLRMVIDHDSGPAAVRVLTGARWRLGIADLAALSRRARHLSDTGPAATTVADGTDDPAMQRVRNAMAEALDGEDIDDAGLVDALADPGSAEAYSQEGYRRITALGEELRYLRSHLPAPLTDIVADIERTVGLDVEMLLTPDGRTHLDAFAAVVADVAATGAGPVELLDYLAVAGEREDGLALGHVQPKPGRVQVMTVHGAKGLEWDIVAVPHLSAAVFPADRGSTWLGDASQLPPNLRGDDAAKLTLPDGADQGRLVKAIEAHLDELRSERAAEERRLFYVALTRARSTLLLSAHHWGATGKKPRGPGEFFTALAGNDGESSLVTPEIYEPAPEDGASNPATEAPIEGSWPIDPLGGRRASIKSGADRVLQALAETRGPAEHRARFVDAPPTDPATAPDDELSADPDGWQRDVDLLLAERATARAGNVVDVPLPGALSVSALVDLASDPQQLARTVRRPLPNAPAPQARRGTAFHAWIERYYVGEALLDLDELPGAHDDGAASDDHLAELIAAFEQSAWAERSPLAVEVPFATNLNGLTIRGRMDAVFAEPDGGALVVDWKTGAIPTGDRAEFAAIQLAAYRLAWSRLRDIPLDRVRAAFYYVAARQMVTPADLPNADELSEMIERSTTATQEESA